jgi:Zn-dependent protease
MLGDYIVNAALYALPLLLGVISHEVAHGWTAEKLGDPTARLAGRITLNPLSHIDLIGTVLLPITLILLRSPFLFGWAKPVPVHFANLRGGRRDMAIVALSGPVTNFFMAVASALVYHLLLSAFQQGWITEQSGLIRITEPLFLMARISVSFNLVLMVINLLPIPPLDGGRVMVGLLPYSWGSRLERVENYGMLVVLLLIGTGLWGYIVQPVLSVFLRLFLG